MLPMSLKMLHPLCPVPKPAILKTDVISLRSVVLKLRDTEQKLFFSVLALEFLPKINKLDFSFKSIRPMNSKSLKQVNIGYVFHSALVKKNSYSLRMGVVRDE